MKDILSIINLAVLLFWVTNCNTSNRCLLRSIQKPCERIDYHLLGYYKDTSLVDYVQRNNTNMKVHIVPRNQLKPLKTIICTDSLIIIQDIIKNKKIRIELSKNTIDLNSYVLEFIQFTTDYPKFIEKINGHSPYGLFSDEKTVKSIKDFKVIFNKRRLLLDSSEYSYLFFPNFCNTFKSIQPVKAYKSKDERFLYIYIFGANGLNPASTELSEVRSYLAKFVFSIDEGYLGKIVLSNSELSAYQWDCPNFIGI